MSKYQLYEELVGFVAVLVLTLCLIQVRSNVSALKERVTELERCQWQAAPVPPAQKMTGGE